MQRLPHSPRPHWRAQCESLGFTYHSIDGCYWDESVAYCFSAGQIDCLEQATAELHQLCLQAVDWVVRERQFAPFRLSPLAIEEVTRSWQAREPSLYGRFDFSWHGRGEPKLLEYNADTPTGLLEASVIQWHWLNDCHPQADQFNSLHEQLIARWAQLDLQRPVHFTALGGHEEDIGNTLYLQDTAHQAGLQTSFVAIEDIGFDPLWQGFVDLQGNPVDCCFKLYPWEWLLEEPFAEQLHRRSIRFIEPAWKLLLSSKAILPVLWSLFPGHPNLLPASFEPLKGPQVRKPIYSREGSNIEILGVEGALATDGPYADQPCLYQALAPLPQFGSQHAVIGSWVVGDQPAGIGIREDASPITRDSSRFVPHYFLS